VLAIVLLLVIDSSLITVTSMSTRQDAEQVRLNRYKLPACQIEIDRLEVRRPSQARSVTSSMQRQVEEPSRLFIFIEKRQDASSTFAAAVTAIVEVLAAAGT